MEYELKAGGPKPALVWRFDFSADTTGSPIEFLDQLNFKVEQLNSPPDTEVRYLLYKNNPHGKEVAIFFLPEIEPNESRRVRITYRWPGFAKDIIEKRNTKFAIRFKACDPNDTADVQYDFKFAPALLPLTFDQLGPAEGKVTSEAIDAAGNACWRFSNTTLSMNGKKLEFQADRTRVP